jgi:hypothetical protein
VENLELRESARQAKRAAKKTQIQLKRHEGRTESLQKARRHAAEAEREAANLTRTLIHTQHKARVTHNQYRLVSMDNVKLKEDAAVGARASVRHQRQLERHQARIDSITTAKWNETKAKLALREAEAGLKRLRSRLAATHNQVRVYLLHTQTHTQTHTHNSTRPASRNSW